MFSLTFKRPRVLVNCATQVGQCLFTGLLGAANKKNVFPRSLCVCDGACVLVFISQQVINYHMPEDFH